MASIQRPLAFWVIFLRVYIDFHVQNILSVRPKTVLFDEIQVELDFEREISLIYLMSISKVVARFARTANFCILHRIWALSIRIDSWTKEVIFLLYFIEKLDFFSGKMKMKKFMFLEQLFSTWSKAHGWIWHLIFYSDQKTLPVIPH